MDKFWFLEGTNILSEKKQTSIIISITSDIGTALAKRWIEKDWDIYGTYRTKSNTINELLDCGVKLFECDISNIKSINHACLELTKFSSNWDNLIFSTGTQNPVGPFISCNFNEWANSIKVNFINQKMREASSLMMSLY